MIIVSVDLLRGQERSSKKEVSNVIYHVWKILV